MADVVAEQQGTLRAQAQQIAGRQRANHRAGIVDHAEVPDAQTVHPPDRHIGVRIGIDHGERPRHRAIDGLASASLPRSAMTRRISRSVTMPVSAGTRRAISRMHIDRRYLLGGDLRDHHGQCCLRGDETRRRSHDLAHAMPVWIGIDARSGVGERIGRHAGHVGPAGANLLVDQPPQRGGGVDRLAERADAAIAQQRHQLLEYPGGGRCIAERRVALDHLNAEPACDALEREIRQRRIDDLRQEPRTEARPTPPRNIRAHAFALQHREVEPDRMPDQHCVVEIAGKFRPHRGKPRRIGDRGVVEAVDARGLRRDRDIGPHQPAQRRRVGDPAAGQADGTDLDDPRIGRIKPGGLGIHDHGVDRDQRRHAGPVHHRRPHGCSCTRQPTLTSRGTSCHPPTRPKSRHPSAALT